MFNVGYIHTVCLKSGTKLTGNYTILEKRVLTLCVTEYPYSKSEPLRMEVLLDNVDYINIKPRLKE